MDKEPLVSVIVPVYNVSKYINQCIDSILHQTYKNLEILLIDDGSTDGSGKICDEYALTDKRIRVIHKENGGLSDARNVGIENAIGVFIGFVDSDDYISPIYFESMMKALLESGAEIAALRRETGFWDGESSTAELTQSMEECDYTKYIPFQAVELMFLQNIATGAPFKLARRELFYKIRFPKSYLFEDLATTYKLFFAAQSVAVVKGDLYAYRKRADSIIRSEFTTKKLIIIKITEQILGDMEEYAPNLKKAAVSRCFSTLFSIFLQIPRNDKENQMLLWMEIKKYRVEILKNCNYITRNKNILAAIATFGGRKFAHYIGNKFGRKGTVYQ